MPTTLYGTYQRYFRTTLNRHLNNVLTGLIDDVTGVPHSITSQSREALTAAWLDRIQEHLPEGVTVHGEEFYGPCDDRGGSTIDMTQTIEKVRNLNIWDLVEKHAVPILTAFYTRSGTVMVDGTPIGEYTGPLASWPRAVESIIRDAGFSPVPGLDHLTWSPMRRGAFAGDHVTYVVAVKS